MAAAFDNQKAYGWTAGRGEFDTEARAGIAWYESRFGRRPTRVICKQRADLPIDRLLDGVAIVTDPSIAYPNWFYFDEAA